MQPYDQLPRVVVVHDYLTQRGGAERVVLAMLETFAGARLVTSVYAPRRTFPEFARYEIETLLPRRVRLPRDDPRLALPILAPLYSGHTVRDADVVLCSSSGWAHGIRSTAPKVVYCHAPARWLYQADDYVLGHGRATRLAVRAAQLSLRRWDLRAAASASAYVVNSTVVAERVERVYGRKARILHPPGGIQPDGPRQEVAVGADDFLLAVARPRGYKNTAAIAAAARRFGIPIVVVGSAAAEANAGVVRLARVDDAELRWLYANCRALVAAAHEDFGLTPVEAMTFGKPVLALRSGGYLDTVVEGETGLFFDRPDAASIADAIDALTRTAFDSDEIRRHAATFSPERFALGLREIVAEAASDSAGER